MKFRYEFVTGETVEIEVPEKIGEDQVLIEIDESIRREARKWHKSLEAMREKGAEKRDNRAVDASLLIEQKEARERLYRALDKLLPQQRELVEKVFIKGWAMVDVAHEDGVDESAISHRIDRIRKKLKKILESGLDSGNMP